MGCGNCSTGTGGKPGGCKGNGGCSSGGCNRLNVFDWLSAIPLHDGAKPYPIVEVSFNKGSRKDFFRNSTQHILEKGDMIAVEGVGGYDVGQVSLTGELVKLQLKKYGVQDTPAMKRVLRPASDDEITHSQKQKEREAEVLIRSRAIARSLNLEMKLCEVEIQADGKKGTFFYTADQRVDFRELIRVFAGDFKLKVEMKQIGARQESGKVGGIGSCGRELCCSTWLTDFKSVNTTAARYQNLSINQTKLSGQCGRLKCCLNYELDTYMDALSVFPDNVESLETIKGVAHLVKKDIFKNLMWYTFHDSSKQYPLTITRVKEIQILNKQGQKAEELQPVELETRSNKGGVKVDMGFVNDAGQISLKAFERKDKKKGSNNSGRKQEAAGGDRKQGGQEAGSRKQGDRPEAGGRKPQGDRPQSNKPQGNRPQRAEGPKTEGQPDGQEQSAKPQGNRPQGNKPQGNRPQGNRPQGNRGQGNRSQGEAQTGADQPQANGQEASGGQQGNKQGQQKQRPPRGPRPERRERPNNDDKPKGDTPPQAGGEQQS